MYREKRKIVLEKPGFEPGAFHMRSERSTTELHPLTDYTSERPSPARINITLDVIDYLIVIGRFRLFIHQLRRAWHLPVVKLTAYITNAPNVCIDV